MPEPSPPPPPAGRWLGRRRLAAAALAAAALFAGCVSLDEQQRRWIFQPGNQMWAGAHGASASMREVWIEYTPPGGDAAVRLHALWQPAARADAPVLLYLHGARWDVRSSAYRMRRMVDLGFSVLGVDYRGFGRSTQALPSEASALEDARAAWHWLAREHPHARRFIFGHSLGGAIGVQLAAELPAAPSPGVQAIKASAVAPPRAGGLAPAAGLSGLIVEGSFTSIADVFRSFKWGWLPITPLITQRFEAAEKITMVRAPVLVVHGSEDQLIKPALGRALFERAQSPKRFVLVEGGSHHNTNSLGQRQYREAIRELFGLQPPES